MDTQPLSVNKMFFLTKPSFFKTLLIVLSEGNWRPDLLNSHLIAETPTWAKRSDSKRFLVAIMACLSSLFIFVGFCFGSLDRSLNQSWSPVWYRFEPFEKPFL
jgi:hypothetical protein